MEAIYDATMNEALWPRTLWASLACVHNGITFVEIASHPQTRYGFSMHTLRAVGLRVARLGRTILDAATLDLEAGRITVVCGPNGSGKSTLLRCLAGLDRPSGGAVLLDGADLAMVPRRQAAQRLATVLQGPPPPQGLTVTELAMLGRHPHRSTFAPEAAADRVAVARALNAVALTGLAERTVETLSGGERQRAWIAMALAQEPALLLLDEPTTYLDLRHQVDLLALIQRLNRDAGLTIVAVLHDLNQALAIGDHAVLLRSGQVLATGAPSEVLNETNLREAFGLDIAVVRHPLAPLPYCVPRWTGA